MGNFKKKHVHPPTPAEMFNISSSDFQQNLNDIEVAHSTTYHEKGSQFTGYAVKVTNTTDVKAAYKKSSSNCT